MRRNSLVPRVFTAYAGFLVGVRRYAVVAVAFLSAAAIAEMAAMSAVVPLFRGGAANQASDRVGKLWRFVSALTESAGVSLRPASICIAGVVLFGLAAATARFFGNRLLAHASARAEFLRRSELVEWTGRVGWSVMSARQTSDYGEMAAAELAQLRGMLVQFLLFLTNVVCTTILLTTAAVLSFKSTIITLLLCAVVGVGTKVLGRGTRRLNEAYFAAKRDSAELNVGFYRHLKYWFSSGYLSDIQTATKASFRRVEQTLHGLERLQSASHFVAECGAAFAIGTFLIVTAGADSETSPDALLLMGILFRTFPRVVHALPQLMNSQRSVAFIERLLKDLGSNPRAAEVSESPVAPRPRRPYFDRRITLEDVSVTFGSEAGRAVMRSVNLTLERGKTYVVVGPSGSGKSTLLGLLTGLIRPSAGRVLVDDQDVLVGDTLIHWQRRLGVLLQDSPIVGKTISETIVWPQETIDRERLNEVIKTVGLDGLVADLPLGLGSPVGEAATLLSGGERQRLALARVLYPNPDLLLMDEPTSALDHEAADRFKLCLAALRGRHTIVLVTHDESFEKLADVVVRIENGTVRNLEYTSPLRAASK